MNESTKLARYHNFKSGKLEVSERTLLEHFKGTTESGAELISEFDHEITVYWNYVGVIYTLQPHGEGVTERENASYIRYEFSPFDDTGKKKILINHKNDGHPAIKKVEEFRK